LSLEIVLHFSNKITLYYFLDQELAGCCVLAPVLPLSILFTFRNARMLQLSQVTFFLF